MNWTTAASQRQLLSLSDQLLVRQSELDQREASIAAAAVAPWEGMAVQQAEQVGAETRTLQILGLLEQQLDWLESSSPAAIVLGTLREQILNLESLRS